MKTSEFCNTVLSYQETLKMLQGFCYEALRFLKVSVEKFPKFVVGVAMQADGKANPLKIDYTHSKVLVCIPVFRILFSGVTGNDAPTVYRLMGYQLARFGIDLQLSVMKVHLTAWTKIVLYLPVH